MTIRHFIECSALIVFMSLHFFDAKSTCLCSVHSGWLVRKISSKYLINQNVRLNADIMLPAFIYEARKEASVDVYECNLKFSPRIILMRRF